MCCVQNGIKTYLFDGLRPTPELSFAVHYLGCARRIVITASHNPKEYNGYKVYGEDGGQIPPSVADKIIKHIDNTDIFDGVKLCNGPKINIIGEEVESTYIMAVKEQSLGTKIPEDFKVVYTSLHGSGNVPVRRILAETGIKNVFTVPEQEKSDGDRIGGSCKDGRRRMQGVKRHSDRLSFAEIPFPARKRKKAPCPKMGLS